LLISPATNDMAIKSEGSIFCVLAALLTLGLCNWGCGGRGTSAEPSPTSPTESTATVTAVRVTGPTSFTTSGQTGQFVATANVSNGSSQTVTSSATWQSSNAAVATVSASGLLKTVGPGATTVTAAYQGVSGSAQVSWSYTIDPSPFLMVETGTLPVVISAPHGGTLPVPGVPIRSTGTTLRDINTLELATATQAALMARAGQKAHFVAALASRKYVDFNEHSGSAYESPAVASLYDAYYVALTNAVGAVNASSGQSAILVDVHGQSDNVQAVFRGTRNGQTASLSALYAPGGLLTRLLGLNVTVDPPTGSDTENPSFNGGNIVASYGLRAGGIQAIQLEFGPRYRQPANVIADTASKLSDAIISAVNCSSCR
jgi:N-formylglutamate amidohydrolase